MILEVIRDRDVVKDDCDRGAGLLDDREIFDVEHVVGPANSEATDFRVPGIPHVDQLGPRRRVEHKLGRDSGICVLPGIADSDVLFVWLPFLVAVTPRFWRGFCRCDCFRSGSHLASHPFSISIAATLFLFLGHSASPDKLCSREL
jgi:hypothetical protein